MEQRKMEQRKMEQRKMEQRSGIRNNWTEYGTMEYGICNGGTYKESDIDFRHATAGSDLDQHRLAESEMQHIVDDDNSNHAMNAQELEVAQGASASKHGDRNIGEASSSRW